MNLLGLLRGKPRVPGQTMVGLGAGLKRLFKNLFMIIKVTGVPY